MTVRRKLLLSLIALALVTVIISRYYHNNTIVMTFLCIACAVIIVKSWKRKLDLLPFVVAAVIGPTIEATIIHYGAWQYANPTAFGIPIWLPLLWGFAGYFMTKMSSWIQKLVT